MNHWWTKIRAVSWVLCPAGRHGSPCRHVEQIRSQVSAPDAQATEREED